MDMVVVAAEEDLVVLAVEDLVVVAVEGIAPEVLRGTEAALAGLVTAAAIRMGVVEA
jgi:hypothetical protein